MRKLTLGIFCLFIIGCSDKSDELTNEMLVGEWNCEFYDTHYKYTTKGFKQDGDKILKDKQEREYALKDGLLYSVWGNGESYQFDLDKLYNSMPDKHIKDGRELTLTRIVQKVSWDHFIITTEFIHTDEGKGLKVGDSKSDTDMNCQRVK